MKYVQMMCLRKRELFFKAGSSSYSRWKVGLRKRIVNIPCGLCAELGSGLRVDG